MRWAARSMLTPRVAACILRTPSSATQAQGRIFKDAKIARSLHDYTFVASLKDRTLVHAEDEMLNRLLT